MFLWDFFFFPETLLEIPLRIYSKILQTNFFAKFYINSSTICSKEILLDTSQVYLLRGSSRYSSDILQKKCPGFSPEIFLEIPPDFYPRIPSERSKNPEIASWKIPPEILPKIPINNL